MLEGGGAGSWDGGDVYPRDRGIGYLPEPPSPHTSDASRRPERGRESPPSSPPLVQNGLAHVGGGFLLSPPRWADVLDPARRRRDGDPSSRAAPSELDQPP
ncbi:RNA polymerase sigma-28 subunit [Marssonina coronariae]|uniref:RNA polymerase sigma-28 subunit n=1 Tax=Diplocarpon coronariae TaxID=2795749 RepID=A0A218ZBV0_9HELO|nr:RNA polymerase sigma-28 subunit [Marssonina coronariae]